jgi:hypothetical protein
MINKRLGHSERSEGLREAVYHSMLLGLRRPWKWRLLKGGRDKRCDRLAWRSRWLSWPP